MSGEARRVSISASLLNANGTAVPIDGNPIGQLQLLDGELDGSIHTALRWSGKITVLNSAPEGGWDRYRISIQSTTTGDGATRWHQLGTFIPATSMRPRPGQPAEIELYSSLLLLQDSCTTETVSVLPTLAILPSAWLFAYEAGVNSDIGLGIPGLGPEMREAQVWPAGTPHLRIVNDLLATAGWTSADVTPTGWVTAEPWRAPSSRGVAHTFRAGPEALHTADWSEEQDVFSIPNRVVCHTAGGEEPALSAFAEDHDPNSPTSIPSRGGRVVTLVEEHEAASQAALQAIADRRIATVTQRVRNITLRHLPVPGVSLNSVVQLVNDEINERCVVTKQRVPLSSGGLVESNLRVVTT